MQRQRWRLEKKKKTMAQRQQGRSCSWPLWTHALNWSPPLLLVLPRSRLLPLMSPRRSRR
jgi:hypothetical protein